MSYNFDPGTELQQPEMPAIQRRPPWHLLLAALGGLTLAGVALRWVFLPPLNPPRILAFATSATTYQVGRDPVRLNWQIDNPDPIQAVRITPRLITGASSEQPITYSFSQGLPPELKPFCQMQAQLVCQGVPTDAQKVGQYEFELAIFVRQPPDQPIATQVTSAITIQANPTQLVSFRIDGKEVKVNSKYLVPLDPKQPLKQLVLTWQVSGGPDLKVELTPTPGVVQPKGSFSYPVPQKTSTNTFTLVVSNGAGVQTRRAVVIETYPLSNATSPTQPAGSPTLPLTAAIPLPIVSIPRTPVPDRAIERSREGTVPDSRTVTPSPSLTTPVPTDPGTLSPSEVPPQFDSR